jgi:hypothetical protein
MHVVENTSERLVLRGTPGGGKGMIALVAVGLLLTGVTAAIGVHEHGKAGGFGWDQLWLAMMLFVAQTLFWSGAVTLAVGKVSLVLDRVTREGAYDVVSPIVDAGKPCRFRLDDVADLEIERTVQVHPTGKGGPGSPVETFRLRLLVLRPRAAITLDETQNNGVERLDRLGATIAGWLGIARPQVPRD